MVGTNLPNAPIAIALHDRALQAEGAAPATLAHYSHTLTVARPSVPYVWPCYGGRERLMISAMRRRM
jgi:hypothetical protein